MVHLFEANMQYSRGNLLPFYSDMDSFDSIFSPGLGFFLIYYFNSDDYLINN